MEDGVQGTDDKRRFKIVMKPALANRKESAKHTIELDSIGDFCKAKKMDEQASEQMVSLILTKPRMEVLIM
jgi:eukaryotic translation initiation factor 2C